MAAHIGYYIQGVGGNDLAYKSLPQTANKATNLNIEMRTIGIELINWGNLTLKNGKYYTYINTIVPEDQVIKLDKSFRGFQYYQKYTKEQINSTIELIKILGAKFNIPLKFSQFFEFDKNAVLGVPGIYSHTNYRFDKVDLHPEPEMVQALKQFT